VTSPRPPRRVAITGIGAICALGAGREEVWRGLADGRCGIGQVSLFDTEGYRSRLAAEIQGPVTGGFTAIERRRLSRSDRVAIVASMEALHDAALLDSGIDPGRVGVMFGSGTADLLRGEEYVAEVKAKGLGHARPSKVFNHFSSTPVDAVGRKFGLRGVRACPVAACSSSTIAIGYGADAVAGGLVDAAVCGGSDVLSRLTFSGFNALRLVDTEPCRPFDAARNGMNIGEAGAVLVLEEMERARKRGARIYAELAGYGLTCEAYHPTAPEPEGKALAATLGAALGGAGVDADEVDHVNAHGTGTPHNDRAEARGLHQVFGARASRIPVTSIKSMVGHCLGAAGAIEAVALALTIANGVVPPTIHHERTDPECDLDIVSNTARQARVRCGISTSLAFGGNNAALVMRAV
jgi:3-oxoacyl-[acyl-carrier-protein] synthase II